MALITGIIILLAISVLTIYILLMPVFAAYPTVATTPGSILEDTSTLINISIANAAGESNITNVTIDFNVASYNFTISHDNAEVNSSVASNFTNGTAGQSWVTFINSTPIDEGALIAAGATEYFWLNVTADTPGSYNITINISRNGTIGDVGENFSAYNSTSITLVVNDTTGPVVTLNISLEGLGRESNTATNATNGTNGAGTQLAHGQYINSSRTINYTCTVADNYNATGLLSLYVNGVRVNSSNTTTVLTGVGGNQTNTTLFYQDNVVAPSVDTYTVWCGALDNSSNQGNASAWTVTLNAWDMSGFVQNSTYSGAPANVSLYAWSMTAGQPPTIIMNRSVTTNGSGWFIMRNLIGNATYASSQYQLKIIQGQTGAYSENAGSLGANETGPFLPPFPSKMYETMLYNSTFYMQEAGTLVLNAFNGTDQATGNRSFQYEINDVAIGMPIAMSISTPVSSNKTFIVVPKNRNYTVSIMRSPIAEAGDSFNWGTANDNLSNGTATPPMSFYINSSSFDVAVTNNISRDLYSNAGSTITKMGNYTKNGLSAQRVLNLSMNLTSSNNYLTGWARVVKNATNINLSYIAVRLMPSEGIIPPNSELNLGPSFINITTAGNISDAGNDTRAIAHFNITLMGSAMGINYLVEFYSNSSGPAGGTQYFGAIENITITGDTSLNVTLGRLAGEYDSNAGGNAGMWGNANTSRLTFRVMAFNMTNNTAYPLTRTNGIEFITNSTRNGLLRYIGLSLNSSGHFAMPVLNTTEFVRVNVYDQNFAPLSNKIIIRSNAIYNPMTGLGENSTNITLKPFNPERINANGSKENMSDSGATTNMSVFFMKHTAGCDIQMPDSSTCQIGSTQNASFDPVQAMLAGKANIRYELAGGLVVYFIGVDLLASGPPSPITSTTNISGDITAGSTVSQIWRVGSLAPQSYKYVYVGIPYEEASFNEAWNFNASLYYLYDPLSNGSAIWNISINSTAELPAEYADFNTTWFLTVGIECTSNIGTTECYKNTGNNTIWLNLSHFSEQSAQVAAYAPASAPPEEGGGGGGIPAKTISHSWDIITPGETAIYKVNEKDIGIKTISIEVSNQANDAKITITKQDSKPASVTKEISGKVYKYMWIKQENLANKLSLGKIVVYVLKSWLTDNGLSASDLSLFRWDADAEEWEQLPTIVTTVSDPDPDYEYLEAETTEFSYFMIGETPAPLPPGVECGNALCESGENCENCIADCPCASDEECVSGVCEVVEGGVELEGINPWVWFIIIIVVVVILIVIIVIMLKKKK